MARSSPEKLAAALRANLRRRKQGGEEGPQVPPDGGAGESAHAPDETVPAEAENPGQD